MKDFLKLYHLIPLKSVLLIILRPEFSVKIICKSGLHITEKKMALNGLNN